MARSLLLLASLVCASALNVDLTGVSDAGESETPLQTALKAYDAEQNQNAKVTISDGRTITIQKEYTSGRSRAERAAMPAFSMPKGPASRNTDGFSWPRYRWNLDSPGLRSHPALHKKKDGEDTQFAITCCLDKHTAKHFLNLPQRSPEKPYLVKVLDAGKDVQHVLNQRPDIYVLDYDLRDAIDKADEPVRGVTIAPHNYFTGKKQGPTEPRKYFVTFQGRKTSKLRHELHDAFNGKDSHYRNRRDVSVETVMDRNWNVQQQTGDNKFNDKMNTTYALLPKGDDRWSLRFSEAVGANAIPVILADGLTLPYENIIDWSTAAIRLPNSYAQDSDKLMKALPSDKETIVKMRTALHEINKKYFATPEARADAMLLDAAALVKKGGKYSPLWNDYTQK